MPETPIEKLMGWLEREEEEFGLTGAVSRTIDPEACRRMLYEELGYEPSASQVTLMYETGRYKYAEMPMIGVRTELVTTYRGTIRERTDLWYRDIPTGKRVGLETVQRRLLDIGLR